jgi:hypothetical protein
MWKRRILVRYIEDYLEKTVNRNSSAQSGLQRVFSRKTGLIPGGVKKTTAPGVNGPGSWALNRNESHCVVDGSGDAAVTRALRIGRIRNGE